MLSFDVDQTVPVSKSFYLINYLQWFEDQNGGQVNYGPVFSSVFSFILQEKAY